MKKINKHAALVFFFLLFTSLIQAQDYKPLIKVSKGEKYSYNVSTDMVINMSAGGQDIKIVSNSSCKANNSIEKVSDNGNIDVVNTTADLKITTSGMGMDSVINHEGKVGPTFKQQFDKLGNLISKSIIDSSQMELNVSNSNVFIFCEFPSNNLKPGDKWTKEKTDSMDVAQFGGKMGTKGIAEYTFGPKEKIDGMDLFKVTYTSTLTVGGKGSVMGMNIFMEGTGVSNGEIYFNPANGIIYTSKGNIEMDINIVVTGQQSMTMPMNQKITISQKLIK